jgi:DNA-binding transcriptional regulator GbsR (MarR family)
MSNIELRREFLSTIGETYVLYGYPEYCGWIEGLLLLESKEWSQAGIAKRLGEIFPDSKYPTSISSVNRALKLLENYGVVEKAGSRRTGYQYRILSSSNLIASMLQQLNSISQNFIKKMRALKAKGLKKDRGLGKAIAYQIDVAQEWIELCEGMLKIMSDEEKG